MTHVSLAFNTCALIALAQGVTAEIVRLNEK